jgi:protein TonB
MTSTAVQTDFDLPPRLQPVRDATVLPLRGADDAPPSLANHLGVQTLADIVQKVKARPFEFALLALFSIGLHVLLMQLFSKPHDAEAEKPPVIPEMTIEFARPLPQAAVPKPPATEPPKPRSEPQPVKKQAAATPAKTQAPTAAAAPTTSSDAGKPVNTNATNNAPVAAVPTPLVEEPLTEPKGRAGYLKNPEPDYPPQAQRQGWEGTVLLKVHVLANGQPDSVDVQKTSGRKILDQAAITAVQGWAFAPAKRGQRPVDGWVTVPIEFKLGG